MLPFRRTPAATPSPPSLPLVTLGTAVDAARPKSLTLSPIGLRSHMLIHGLSGFGKSSLELGLLAQLLQHGAPFTLIDPHADLADGLLALLAATGFFCNPRAYDRLLYIDWSNTAAVVPFNVLQQPYPPHVIAQNVAAVFHRAWPATDKGQAPLFDSILLSALVVLIENGQSLTALLRLITDAPWREALLRRCTDPDVVAFFRDRFAVWGKGVMLESTARRLQLLTFNPVLRASLGSTANALDPRTLIDRGTSVIHNLGGLDDQTQRFLGGLIATGSEQAALARADTPEERRRPHHLLLEEFPMFLDTSVGLDRMLALVRKFRLYLALCHQTDSQASAGLQGALGNIGLEVAFRLNADDAHTAAPRFLRFDPQRLTRTGPQSAPRYMSRGEQLVETMATLATLPPRQALVRQGDTVARIATLTIPPQVDHAAIAPIKQRYAQRFAGSVETARQPGGPTDTVTAGPQTGSPAVRSRREAL